MVKFLSGPPGGLNPPLTATKLSDLAGGAFGPGSSVASTGMNAHRAVIKAALARSAGETWEDVLEYYLVSSHDFTPSNSTHTTHSFFLKDVGDARRIRSRLLACFEAAALPTTSDDMRRKLLNFAVVGGGPTGIEFAAELHDM